MSPDKCQEKRRRDKEDHEPNKSSTSDNERNGKVKSGSEKDAKHATQHSGVQKSSSHESVHCSSTSISFLKDVTDQKYHGIKSSDQSKADPSVYRKKSSDTNSNISNEFRESINIHSNSLGQQRIPGDGGRTLLILYNC